MDPCKEKEPRVIDDELLMKCIHEQVPKGEAGRLARSEGIPFEEVEQIRLEFLNILRIDHLWVLNSLTKLGLNNNLIEKIENLGTLIHLTELDLSFNKITKLENLENLLKLQRLSLYDNLITKIENLDTLEELKIFSIGKNKIADLDNVLYLRRLSKLQSLNMEGNPCANEENFRMFIAVFLPQLRYYEYKKIYDFEKEQGLEIYGKKLMVLEEEEGKQRESIEMELKIKSDAELHSVSFVEYLNSDYLFLAMFDGDEEGNALLTMGEEVQEIFNDYKTQFVNVCNQIFILGQEQYKIRKAEIDQFMSIVEGAKKENQDRNIQFMEEFNTKKTRLYARVRQLQDKLDENDITMEAYDESIDGITAQFDELLKELWRNLMKLELELFEQVEEVNQTFEHALAEMVNVFIEGSQGLFSQIRELEVNYSEQVSECAGRFLTTANLTENFQMPEQLKQIMSDKEAVANALSGSHDMHLIIIDNREDTLVSKARQWLNGIIEDLQKNEITRNRTKVLEISHFVEIQRDELDDVTSRTVHNIDPEVGAVFF